MEIQPQPEVQELTPMVIEETPVNQVPPNTPALSPTTFPEVSLQQIASIMENIKTQIPDQSEVEKESKQKEKERQQANALSESIRKFLSSIRTETQKITPFISNQKSQILELQKRNTELKAKLEAVIKEKEEVVSSSKASSSFGKMEVEKSTLASISSLPVVGNANLEREMNELLAEINEIKQTIKSYQS